ncbi:hypothetical protein D6C78_04719 [Aureobasidium pullulans]|uniref:Outer spore wall protein RRT8 n=1 Tax=Aureobasidium pullulans TaxID=5580 RepID=A0A4T0BSI8_AURPU|nr:hypothetical protein D6C78_04719 [Aureobasidium pullulans]
MTAQDKVKDTVREEAQRVANLASDAAQSGAYLYPIRGIAYFLAHRDLWKPLASKLIPTLLLGISTLAGVFVFGYLPQAAVLAVFNGPLAAINAALLCLNESSTIFNTLAKTFLVEESLIDTFDGTLVAKGEAELVSKERKVGRGGDAIGRLGKIVKKPFAKFAPSAIIRYVMYLPLNFIPVVGTVMFILLQGKRAGPAAHSRYFQLKGMNKARQDEWVEKRQGAYTGFGTVATLLELVPIAGVFFAFTNTTGAALWAADLESRGNDRQSTAQLRDQSKKAI